MYLILERLFLFGSSTCCRFNCSVDFDEGWLCWIVCGFRSVVVLSRRVLFQGGVTVYVVPVVWSFVVVVFFFCLESSYVQHIYKSNICVLIYMYIVIDIAEDIN